MIRLLQCSILCLLSTLCFSQQVGIGTNNPDPSAKLEIESTTSGLLIPRMTSLERLAISSPVKGLMVFDNTTSSFWFFDGTTWNDISSSTVSLDNAYDDGGAGLGRVIVANDSAVLIEGTDGLYVSGTFGQGTDVEIEGAGTRMFFNPKKSAFRVGNLSILHRNSWDIDSIGDYSFASGNNTKATGLSSTAIGYKAEASGLHSVAMGSNTEAKGGASTAIGNFTNAKGINSIAMGSVTSAIGPNSTAMGHYSQANGGHSTAMGRESEANGEFSTAMGKNSEANGYASTVIGQYNDPIIATQTSISNNTPLFIVGNGDNTTARSNAMVVRKDGRVEINDEYTLPTADGTSNQVMTTDGSGIVSWQNAGGSSSSNTLDGAYNEGGAGLGRKINASDSSVLIEGTDGFYVTGTYGQGTDVEITGTGTRMFFNPKKSAFRAGTSLTNRWSSFNVGEYSFASGYNTLAEGDYSTALGRYTEATGDRATAIGTGTDALGYASLATGNNTEASGQSSTAMGYTSIASGAFSTSIGSNNKATGYASLAMGHSSKAFGNNSTALGNHTQSNGYASTSIGLYNDTIVSPQILYTYNTPLFTVGNGNNFNSLSNAFMVNYGGQVEINDAYTLPTSDGSVNQVMTTNGSGTLSWQNSGAGGSGNLDNAYNEGGAGRGRKINASDSAVVIEGTDGFYITGTAGQGTDVEIEGAGTRMFFNPKKAAFRVGRVLDFYSNESTFWDNDSIGLHSFSSGINTLASGYTSTALGNSTNAAGDNSTAIGFRSSATGDFSIAMGELTKAIGANSTAMGYHSHAIGSTSFSSGYESIASGNHSTAMGQQAKATGNHSAAIASYAEALGHFSTVLGNGTDARGNTSTAMGSSTNANGGASTSIGLYSTANGEASTAIGNRTIANGYASTVIGLFNDTIVTKQTSYTSTTPLFIIGNGDNFTVRRNAMVVRKDGKSGFGVNPSSDRLQVNSETGENALRVQVAGSTKFRVFANGSIAMGSNNTTVSTNDVYIHDRLGIGNPTPDYKLSVKGTINLKEDDGNGVAMRVQGDEALWYDGSVFSWGFGGSTNYFADEVGIGTDNPSQKLHVVGNIFASGTVTSSDERYKKDIVTLENSTEALSKVNPVSYTFKTEEFPDQFDEKKHIGVIAQDLEKIFPDMVYTDNEGYKAVNYTEFIPLLIQSNQEQQELINKQETELNELNKKLEALYQMMLKNQKAK